MGKGAGKWLAAWLLALVMAVSLLPAAADAAETENKRAYYQIIMEDGTAIKLYPGETDGHCIRTNESKAAEPAGGSPNDYVVKLVGKPAGSMTYHYELYLKNFKGQSITYCDGETGGPNNRDYLYIEVEGDNYLTAGKESLRDGVYTAIGRTILKGNQDITYRISNNHPAKGFLNIKAVNGDVPGMQKAYGIACQNLNISGSAIQSGSTFKPGSFVLNINLSGNKTGGDRAITVTNRFMIDAYASMILNVQGLNAVYNESKFYGNHTTRPPGDEFKFTYFLINTEGNVNIILDTMGLDGRVSAFYNNYYPDHNYAPWTDGVSELRKVGKMEITVKNLNSDQLEWIRTNPIGRRWGFDTLPAWEKKGGYGITLKELQTDNTCVFKFEKNQVNIANLMIYDGAIDGSDYSLRAYKDCASTGTTIYAPITAPEIWTGIPFKCWTTVDGAPLNFTSADGATDGNLAVLQLKPKSITKLLAMYDPFTSQPKWQPVYNSADKCYDGKITWEAAYGMQVAAGRLVSENYELNDSLEPKAVIDSKGVDVVQVDSNVSKFSIEAKKCDYVVPEGRYRIALKDGRDNRWNYSEPFNISYALAEPQISPEGGFPKDNKVNVTISAAADAKIWYTVYDYTTQTVPDAQLYTEPLEIPVTSDRGTVFVKAYAVKDGKQSAWAEAQFSAKPAAPTVTLPDDTTAKNGATYTYYDTAVIRTAAAPKGVEIRYGTEPLSDKNLGTKLGKDGKFSVSGGDGKLQPIYVRARKTIRSGNRTYSEWSDPVSFEMVRVADLTTPILKVNGSVMNSGSTYTVDGSATVTLTRAVGCPVDAEIVYTDKSAIPSYCDVYTEPITISKSDTDLNVYMRAWNSETNCYDASPGATYSFKIKPGTTLRRIKVNSGTAYDSTREPITQAYSGTVVTVKADPAASGRSFYYWSSGAQHLENENVEKYWPEVTFVMPDRLVLFEATYTSSTTINYTKVIVNMGTANVGNSIYLDDPAFRSLSYSWWEGDKVGTEAEKLHDWMSFDPNKTYTAKVTITANKDVSFAANTEVAVAKRTAPNRAFTVPSQKLTKAGQSISFEIHPATKLALTLPSLHHGDKMPTKADIKGLPYGISVERMTWASTPPAYAGPSGTEYTISELVLNINGTCPQIFTSSTVNGVPYDRDYSAGNGQITLKNIKVPVVAEGVTVSGKLISYNPNYDVSVRLMQGDTEMYTAAVAAPTAASGQAEQSFSFASVAMGTYDLVVVKAAHLTYTVKNVEVGDMTLDLTKLTNRPYNKITMLCGDINGDRSINADDLNIVWNAANFNKALADATNKLTDINGDGSVNADDLNIVWNAANFNKGLNDCTFNF